MNSSIVTEKNVADPWTLSDYEGESWKDLFESMIEHNQVKVKYLDRGDIESLGLVYDEDHRDFIIDGDEYKRLWFNKETQELTISNGLDYDDSVTWFDGYIKNKSELKVLLTQLDICY
jgi:hypothetical protein